MLISTKYPLFEGLKEAILVLCPCVHIYSCFASRMVTTEVLSVHARIHTHMHARTQTTKGNIQSSNADLSRGGTALMLHAVMLCKRPLDMLYRVLEAITYVHRKVRNWGFFFSSSRTALI